MPKTAAEIIQDGTIRHTAFMERLKVHQTREIVTAINDGAFSEVVEQLAAGLENIKGRGPTVAITGKLRELNKRTRRTLERGFATAHEALDQALADLALAEVEWITKTIDTAMPVQIDLARPAANTIRAIGRTTPIRGELLEFSFQNLSKSAADAVDRAVIGGIVEGRTNDQIVRSIRGTRANKFADGVLNAPRHHIRAHVRSATNAVSSKARELTYEQNKDIISGVKYLATLDSRTTDICASLDGRVFPVGEGERPPMHHQCRSTTTPVLKTWKEMGIDLKEAPAGTRASLNGQVPASITYPEWLKGQPRSIQDEALGKGKAKLFREGKVPFRRLVDQSHRPLSLTEIKRREGIK